VFHTYPKGAVLGASLMITQSFLYNAIFFTYASRPGGRGRRRSPPRSWW
jgi:hypothetical protein